MVAGPPLVAGVVIALDAVRRWRTYEGAMRADRSLPAGRGLTAMGVGLAAYGLAVLIATILD